LPRKRRKCTTITKKVHEDARRLAAKADQKKIEYVEWLIAKDKASKETLIFPLILQSKK
jgi:hypothetical protein